MTGKVLAVMQPYLFPYIGYFNLIHSATDFVFYDDVGYIKQGWINRNRILVNGQPFMMSIPVSNGSANHLIKDVLVANRPGFKQKILRTVEQSYRKAKNFDVGMNYVTNLLDADLKNISEIAINSVKEAMNILGMETRLHISSSDFAASRGVGRKQRLLSLASELQAGTYINPVNGADLYNKDWFSERGVTVQFLVTRQAPYAQHQCDNFVPNLSIIDLLMNLSSDQIRGLMEDYDLI